MRLIENEQLDFDDVLIMPRRSSLNSRSEVEIYRELTWSSNTVGFQRHSMTCIPVMGSNMYPIAVPRVAKILVENGFCSILEKHINKDDLFGLYDILNDDERTRVFPSIGLKDPLDNLFEINEKYGLTGIVIDVPNGYCPALINRVKEIRNLFPNAFIIAGNVVTADMCQDLINAGANAVKVGIGNGCFWGDSLVKTENGLKKLRDINVGEKVLTHLGTFEPVTNKFTFIDHQEIMTINGINCTPSHKFYVAKIEDIPKITDTNYKDYCVWIEAKDLDPQKYQLVEIEP